MTLFVSDNVPRTERKENQRGKDDGTNKHDSTNKSPTRGLCRYPVLRVLGKYWSPSVFKNARIAGLTRDAAWAVAFV